MLAGGGVRDGRGGECVADGDAAGAELRHGAAGADGDPAGRAAQRGDPRDAVHVVPAPADHRAADVRQRAGGQPRVHVRRGRHERRGDPRRAARGEARSADRGAAAEPRKAARGDAGPAKEGAQPGGDEEERPAATRCGVAAVQFGHSVEMYALYRVCVP